MSWKGFVKAATRLPQQIAVKAGYAEETVDQEYNELQKRFTAFNASAKKLFEESTSFKDSLALMLEHQKTFAATLAEVFAPINGTGSHSSLELEHSEDQYLKMATSFEDSTKEILEQLKPELDVIERRVIQPTADLIQVMESVKKVMTKRDHKLVDYDRYRNATQKLADRTDRDVSAEKKLGHNEIALDTATREYENVNNLLKQQLPILLTLKTAFIDPCFQTLYWYQLHCHHVLYHSFYTLGSQTFDMTTLPKDVFEKKFPPCLEILGSLNLVKRPLKRENSTRTSLSGDQASVNPGISPASIGAPNSVHSNPSPAESAPPSYNFAALHQASTPAAARLPPRPPADSSKKYVVALYDYNGEAEGDLSFRRDDKIELIQRTERDDDWWTGKLNGKIGVFPGNYVAEM